MHANQVAAFCCSKTQVNAHRPMFQKPWQFQDKVYASDGAMMICYPVTLDDMWVETLTEAKDISRAEQAAKMFADAARGELTPLASLNLEPVVEREVLELWESDNHDTGGVDVWVARMTNVAINGATFDARRLLLLRQTMPDVFFHRVDGNGEFKALLLQFSGDGLALVMPCRAPYPALHWDGKRYLPGL